MIGINKSQPPQSLINFIKTTPEPTYSGLPGDYKREVKRSLLKEQRYLCAYCMRKINEDNSTIEHFLAQNPQDGSSSNLSDLDYGNMLAVCDGNEGEPYELQTCDNHRGNHELTFNLWNNSIEKFIYYNSSGFILSERYDAEINDILNLNIENGTLIKNRMAALEGLKDSIKRKSGKREAKIGFLKNLQNGFNTSEKLPEYVGILRWYVNSRLDRVK